MAVVIRLQGLPVNAGSTDIRHFFTGLQIPDGGVHIIGGKDGEAFIVFATDEDARRGMSRTGGVIKNLHVQLLLSSKSEMQSTLEMSRKANKNPKHPAVPPVGDMSRTAKKGGNQSKFENKYHDSNIGNSVSKHKQSYVEKNDKKEANSFNNNVFVYCIGLPYSVTAIDIIHFFKGLDVVEVLFLLRPNGLKNGNAFVKFRSAKDADEAVLLNNEYMGERFISVTKTTEAKWLKAVRNLGEAYSIPKSRTRSRSPQNQQLYVHLKNLSYGIQKEDIRRFFSAPDMEDSQIKFLHDKFNNRTREGFIMLKNERQYEKCLALSKNEFKGRQMLILPIARKAMLALIESHETQTPPKLHDPFERHPKPRGAYEEHPKPRGAYEEHPKPRGAYEEHPKPRGAYEEHPKQRGAYEEHPKQRGAYEEHPKQRGAYEEHPKPRGGYEEPPKQRGMYEEPPKQRGGYEEHPKQRSMYEEPTKQRGTYEEHPKQRGTYEEHPMQCNMYEEYPKQQNPYEEYSRGESSNLKSCVYLRNFPFDVSKAEVQSFFDGFFLHEDDIFLLFDNKGVGLGEAVVRFQSDEQATLAEGLNRLRFLGTVVFVRRISAEQVKEFGAFNDTPMSHSQGHRDDYAKAPLPEVQENSYMGASHDRNEFRRSPERQHGSYPMEIGGRGESYDGFDSGNMNYNNYDNSFSGTDLNFGRPSGAIIRMQNLPYTITINEILDFFYGYNIISSSVDIKYNRKGMTTGHASVCTQSYEEALMAVKELTDKPIGPRNILLSLDRI
ncbi:RNA-binding protein 12B-like [Anomaloglossus baeobatrachus]|uniref:RNA-binding protein 12B-like n=1 Tax=Anomaloglossus baeobatrachus TaxID=238106 RepID=UPI003F502E42